MDKYKPDIKKESIMQAEIKQLFETRTSVRRYEYDAIPDEAMETIYAAIRNSPTSYNGQQLSVIDIADQDVKLKLYEITGQKQIKTCNRFLVFCADYNRIGVLARAKGLEMPPFSDTLDGFTVGVIDAAIAMQSAVVAAQACGLGSCCVGYVRTADPAAVARLLDLPKGVFVVCGLAIGVPREHPDVKPKLPRELMIHSNRYTDRDMTAELQAYDRQVTEYNATRSGTKSDNDWCGHILDYYREATNYEMLAAARAQGFDIKK